MSDIEKPGRHSRTPLWDIVNPATGEVDLVGAIRRAVEALHFAGAQSEGVHFFVTCPLLKTLEGAGFDGSKVAVLSQLMQELGVIRRLEKQANGSFRWWITDVSFLEMYLYPEVIEYAKSTYAERIHQGREILRLTRELADRSAELAGRDALIKLLSAEAKARQAPVTSDVPEENLSAANIVELSGYLQDERDRVDELERQVKDLQQQLAESKKLSATELLAAALVEARKRRSGGTP